MENADAARRLRDLLGLAAAPVAIAFASSPPPGLDRVAAPAPAGCGYWSLASDGQLFYTEASDHLGCPIGAYTHNVHVPADREAELGSMLEMMSDLAYLRMAEVPDIPRRQEPTSFVIYGPLNAVSQPPDVVLIRGNARQMMLLAEAAQAAGVAPAAMLMGRPTCAILPYVMQDGSTATSVGCIGNRVYTGLSSDEQYFAVRGAVIEQFVDKLTTVVAANNALESFHRARVAAPATEVA
ncbi:MAG: DUF169 domain-containing protein [Chloroflexi bacterium]|nr:DUF169 domain-containing protein [Chloroflexota bacterium]